MTHLLDDGIDQFVIVDYVVRVLRVGSVTSVVVQIVTDTDVRFRALEAWDVGTNDLVLIVVAVLTKRVEKVGSGGKHLVSRDEFARVGDGRRESQGQRQGEEGEKGETHRWLIGGGGCVVKVVVGKGKKVKVMNKCSLSMCLCEWTGRES